MDISSDDQTFDAIIPNHTNETSEPAEMKPSDETGIRALTIAALDHVLIHELTAGEACRRASLLFDKTQVATLLRGVMEGHQHRAIVLRDAILARHGIPTEIREQGDLATPLPAATRPLLTMLLDVEKRGVADYRQALRQLDGLTRTQIEAELLPAQESALATLSGAQPPSPDGAV